MEIMKRLVREEEGQGMVEYALIIALIAVVAMAALGPIGTQVKAKLNEIVTKLSGTAAS